MYVCISNVEREREKVRKTYWVSIFSLLFSTFSFGFLFFIVQSLKYMYKNMQNSMNSLIAFLYLFFATLFLSLFYFYFFHFPRRSQYVLYYIYDRKQINNILEALYHIYMLDYVFVGV